MYVASNQNRRVIYFWEYIIFRPIIYHLVDRFFIFL